MKENSNKKGRKHFSKSMKGGEFETVVVNDHSDAFSHIQPVQAKALEVVVYNNSFDKALRAFRALVQKERILSAYKERQSYEKPSDKKRRKRNEMKRKRLELNTFKDGKKTFKKYKSKELDNSSNQ